MTGSSGSSSTDGSGTTETPPPQLRSLLPPRDRHFEEEMDAQIAYMGSVAPQITTSTSRP